MLSAIVLFFAGLLIGVFSPSRWLPHPLLLLTLALVFLDVFLSSLIALQERRIFHSLTHFLIVLSFVIALFAVTLVSGLRAELTVVVPLVIREITLLSRVV